MTYDASETKLCDIADTMPASQNSSLYDRLMAVMPAGMTRNKWAGLAGVNRNVFNDVRENGRLRSDILEKLLDAINVSLAQFEAGAPTPPSDGDVAPTIEQVLQAPAPPYRSENSGRVAILGTALGHDQKFGNDGMPNIVEMTEIDLGEQIGYLPRPARIPWDREVYALYIAGISMEPRYEPGDPIFVDVHQHPAIGDDVIVQLRGGPEGRVVAALVKRLVRRTASYIELEQYNPPQIFRLPIDVVARLQRVIPRRELHG
ncbi:S24 family peptidase [Sphingobium sp. H39-3-25]|uniref:S24 family peptidase n=1 Tax=Sphingobium arseniciresistens TaxID=3030834 RepID=UPI0023B9FAFC|nr:S24 family peptidase [Sphingobium arseniciresistens]